MTLPLAVDSAPNRVRRIVEEMLGEGFALALFVFIAGDGTTRSVFREELDLEDLLRFLLSPGATKEVEH